MARGAEATWGGGNPGGSLLDAQRRVAPALLAREVEELASDHVLVLTGRWWFEPYARELGLLRVDWRRGLVEGLADSPTARWVIAPHPQGKPHALLGEIIAAFGNAKTESR